MRRFSAVLHHRRAGFRANAMAVWKVPEEQAVEVGLKMAESPWVSHCYQRPTFPDWEYTHFTMIHATSEQTCEEVAGEISKHTPASMTTCSSTAHASTRRPASAISSRTNTQASREPLLPCIPGHRRPSRCRDWRRDNRRAQDPAIAGVSRRRHAGQPRRDAGGRAARRRRPCAMGQAVVRHRRPSGRMDRRRSHGRRGCEIGPCTRRPSVRRRSSTWWTTPSSAGLSRRRSSSEAR